MSQSMDFWNDSFIMLFISPNWKQAYINLSLYSLSNPFSQNIFSQNTKTNPNIPKLAAFYLIERDSYI